MTCQPLASSSSLFVYNQDELEIFLSGMCVCVCDSDQLEFFFSKLFLFSCMNHRILFNANILFYRVVNK